VKRGLLVGWLCAVVLVGCAFLAAFGLEGRGPVGERLGYDNRVITPTFALMRGDGDPLAVSIGFPWSEQGYCSGQFTVRAVETADRVVVSQVRSRRANNGLCAGLGTMGAVATVDLILRAPLGDRSVYRAEDGQAAPGADERALQDFPESPIR
jgi:hypothetical protein